MGFVTKFPTLDVRRKQNGRREKEIKRHLSPEKIDEGLNETQQADEARLVRRLNCLKNLSASDMLAEAAYEVLVLTNQPLASGLMSGMKSVAMDGNRASGADGPKLSDQQRERLKPFGLI